MKPPVTRREAVLTIGGARLFADTNRPFLDTELMPLDSLPQARPKVPRRPQLVVMPKPAPSPVNSVVDRHPAVPRRPAPSRFSRGLAALRSRSVVAFVAGAATSLALVASFGGRVL